MNADERVRILNLKASLRVAQILQDKGAELENFLIHIFAPEIARAYEEGAKQGRKAHRRTALEEVLRHVERGLGGAAKLYMEKQIQSLLETEDE